MGSRGIAGVLLHGRHRTADEMMRLAGRLDLAGARWFAPSAQNGVWYPNRFMESIASNEPWLSNAILGCDEAVIEAGNAGFCAEQIAVIGFSQGACLAIEYALRHPDRCRSIIAFTGGLIGPPGTMWRPAGGTLEGIRVLLTSSDIDEWVPEWRVRESAQVLAGFGADVQFRLCRDRPHIVSDEEIAEARDFLLGSGARH